MSHASLARVDALIVSVQNSTASTVMLDNKPPTATQFEALCKALAVNETVATLSLVETNLSDAQLSALCSALKTHKAPIGMLNLEYNDIGDVGALSLADALMEHSKIKTVLLAGNHISDVGAEALVRAWNTNINIAKIDIDMNDVSSKFVKQMAKR